MSSLILLLAAAGAPPCDPPDTGGSYLCQPAFLASRCTPSAAPIATLKSTPRSFRRHLPLLRPGTSVARVGHWWVGSQGVVQHSGIVFARCDGGVQALLQAGPCNPR